MSESAPDTAGPEGAQAPAVAPKAGAPSLVHSALLTLALAAAGGAVLGVVLLPKRTAPPAALPAVVLLGAAVSLDDAGERAAEERARRFVAGSLTLELPGGATRVVPLSQLGATLDKPHLARLLRDARDGTSTLRRSWAERGQGALPLPTPVRVDTARATTLLLRLKDEVDRPPVDARLDLEQRRVVPELIGVALDVDATLDALVQALAAGQARVPVQVRTDTPKRRAAELAGVAFDTVLGAFETPYDRSERYAARTFNLRLAASRLDGTVLFPGELFDFNAVVGPRDELNGYKVAPVIAEGELVDGIGGGTCQVSGTLHGAVFFAGLNVVERSPHTRPSSYTKMGLDATVVYPTINYRLRNDFDFPIVLHEVVRGGVVRAEVLGPKRPRSVTFVRRIDGALPYDEVERPEPGLPSGERSLVQRGVPGFKLRVYRIVRDGPHAVRERWNETYPPTSQIVAVGTGERVGERRVRVDAHPEYLTDELFVMRQRTTPETGERVSAVERQTGKYGAAGWTDAAGMPQFSEHGKRRGARE